jgi:two-component sensor histidine kinase
VFSFSCALVGQNKEKINTCLTTIQANKQDTSLIIAYNELATEFLGSSDEKAKEYAFYGYKLSKQLKKQYLASWSLNLIGMAYDYLGQADSTLFYYQESIKIKQQLNDIDGLGAVTMNIGVMYYYQNNIPNAIRYYNKSMEYYQQANNQNKIAGILNNLAIIYREEGKYNEALAAFKKSYDLKLQNKDTTGMANALGNIGVVYRDLGQYQKAKEYYLNSLKLDSLKSNQYNLVSSYISIAELHYTEKKYSETKTYLQKAIELANKIKALHYLDDAYSLYTKYDSLIGDYKSAFEHQKLFYIYKNELLKEDRLKQMDKLETVFSVKEKEQQIKLLNATSEINELKIQKRDKQLVLFIAISVLLVVLLGLSIFAYRKIRKNKKELQVKNEIINEALIEKEALLKEIHHRVKNNLQVISSLLNLQSRYVKDAGALDALKESKERINAISLLHKEIYQNEVLKLINAKEYFVNLITNLQNTFDPKKNVLLETQVEDVYLDIDTLIPLGLIVNELYTNCYKYGVSNQDPCITFILTQNEKQISLIVKDNGNGFQETLDMETTNSLGFKLVSLFTKKLLGTVVYTNNNGSNTTINFNIK